MTKSLDKKASEFFAESWCGIVIHLVHTLQDNGIVVTINDPNASVMDQSLVCRRPDRPETTVKWGMRNVIIDVATTDRDLGHYDERLEDPVYCQMKVSRVIDGVVAEIQAHFDAPDSVMMDPDAMASYLFKTLTQAGHRPAGIRVWRGKQE